jgi:hypothetical protein
VTDYPSGQDLSGHDLSGADLRHANLTGHDLSGANLTRTDLRDANLAGVNLSGADLRDANLSGADLRGATTRDTVWPEGFSPEKTNGAAKRAPTEEPPREGEAMSGGDQEGPRFSVMIEGKVHAWDKKTISVPEIRSLGGLADDRLVLEMEMAGGEDYGPITERVLQEDEVHELVPLEPGKPHAKHVTFMGG